MIFRACQFGFALFVCRPVAEDKRKRGVAQSGSAPAWGAGGRGFESRQPDHFKTREKPWFLGLFSFPAAIPHCTKDLWNPPEAGKTVHLWQLEWQVCRGS